MRPRSYPSDVTDEQWALIEPHIPVRPGGRPRTTDLRDVVDGIFYVLRTGCQWRHLPRGFPPPSTGGRGFGRGGGGGPPGGPPPPPPPPPGGGGGRPPPPAPPPAGD